LRPTESNSAKVNGRCGSSPPNSQKIFYKKPEA
jgi:hypothetical protein